MRSLVAYDPSGSEDEEDNDVCEGSVLAGSGHARVAAKHEADGQATRLGERSGPQRGLPGDMDVTRRSTGPQGCPVIMDVTRRSTGPQGCPVIMDVTRRSSGPQGCPVIMDVTRRSTGPHGCPVIILDRPGLEVGPRPIRPGDPEKTRVDPSVALRGCSAGLQDEDPSMPVSQAATGSCAGKLRPYVAKRRRVGHLDRGTEVDVKAPGPSTWSGDPEREVVLLRKVSPVVAPYLQRSRFVGAQLTGRKHLSLSGHTGPVHSVHWCPIRSRSHLLLSASVDATVKVWDAVESGACLRTLNQHTKAVRDAHWTCHGSAILSAGFDAKIYLSDVETGCVELDVLAGAPLMTLAPHPSNPNLFLSAGFSPVIKAWDRRDGKVCREFMTNCQQVLDLLFLSGGDEFLASTDAVSRDSADRTIMAWDLGSAARLSNQIFHERYTCPCLCLNPCKSIFAVQTNGNYIALFSSHRPYCMDGTRRLEGHKVEGYGVTCAFSPDGTLLVSGSADGRLVTYCPERARRLRSVVAHDGPCLAVEPHPVLPRTVASAGWQGDLAVWN
uniref:WD repeat domain 25 n=1 Tax=Eptatretus burgeri TaxID=7764 RepID=A0A8C4WZM0_EPTBU